jgi:hypothetical protein
MSTFLEQVQMSLQDFRDRPMTAKEKSQNLGLFIYRLVEGWGELVPKIRVVKTYDTKDGPRDTIRKYFRTSLLKIFQEDDHSALRQEYAEQFAKFIQQGSK